MSILIIPRDSLSKFKLCSRKNFQGRSMQSSAVTFISEVVSDDVLLSCSVIMYFSHIATIDNEYKLA